MKKFCGFALVTAMTLAAISFIYAPASASPTQPISATHIKFVYPDSPETSNAPFPPNFNPKLVRSQLRTVIVRWRGRRMTLGEYLRSLHMDTSKVQTIKVHGDAAAVYTYLK